ncbi:homeobox protein onecut-like [Ischnura elegans]|uniref:homeobox protein onecut-like n=1 Tax=Ischnura elegans TaxID=197161 RepID=UPI001ED8860B|nr:homeobox protein onecut-like [Ischnura elegans]
MSKMGEIGDQASLSEPLPGESVDSPAASTHADLMSPSELSPSISRSAVPRSVATSHESLAESVAGEQAAIGIQIKEEQLPCAAVVVTAAPSSLSSAPDSAPSSTPAPTDSAAPTVVVVTSSVVSTGAGADADPDEEDEEEEEEEEEEDLSAAEGVSLASDSKPEAEAAEASHDAEQEQPLSVIVPAQDDSHDSELLSPGKLSPTSGISVSVASMIDASDFRALQPEPTYQTLTSVNGRMSPPGFSPSSSYATLTPLQPLPPISTMSDKFAYGHAGNVSGSFTVMQNNGLGNLGLGMGVNSPYGYDKLPSMGMSPPHYASPNNGLGGLGIPQQHSPLSPQSSYSQNGGLHSPQKSMSPTGYDSPYAGRDLGRALPQSPTLSPPSASLHSPPNTMVGGFGAAAAAAGLPPLNGLQPQHPPPQPPQQQQAAPQSQQPAPPPPPPPPPPQPQHPPPQQAPPQQQPPPQQQQQQVPVAPQSTPVAIKAPASGSAVAAAAAEVEEINTKELAQRISAELKRYSIPQAIFAQRVLCRSQGTLSDLLRNPKPWSKLKSGRETFRRMWKWLQEPEFQRMSALRLAERVGPVFGRRIPPIATYGPGRGEEYREECMGDDGGKWNATTPPWNVHAMDFNYVQDCQMRNVNVRAVNSKRRKTPSSSCFCADTATRHLQEERRPTDPTRAPTRPQEAAVGFHRPPTAYSAGYF